MVTIIYNGDVSPMNIRVLGIRIENWKTKETRELSDEVAKQLLLNPIFKKISDKKVSVITETKVEQPMKVESNVLDIDLMSKDELLDYTAKNNIKADYSMSVKELREIIKANYI